MLYNHDFLCTVEAIYFLFIRDFKKKLEYLYMHLVSKANRLHA